MCSYSLAATAAGVGLLAAVPANAEVVYTPVNVTIARGQLPIDLNADGINDFLLVDNFYAAPRSRFPLLESVSSPASDPRSPGLLSIGAYPPRPF